MLLQKLIFVQKINKCTYDIILLVCQLAINEIIRIYILIYFNVSLKIENKI